jgi:replicative DNA helicase
MQQPAQADSCGIRPSDLDPACGHDLLLSAVLELHDTGNGTDPALLADHLAKRDQLARIGTEDARAALYLSELLRAAAHALPSPRHYARLIREATIRRQVHTIGSRLIQTAATTADTDVLLDAAADLSLALGVLVDDPTDPTAPIPGLSTFADFVREPSPAHSWVIPGILERADRVMIVAGEGVGKSVLARQVCTLLAAGRHPFAPTAVIPPRRTLLIDLENPPDLVRRGLRGIVGQVWDDGLDVDDRAWRWNRPAGLDLRSAADRALVGRVIEKTRPDLVAIGPLYKASHAKPGDTYEVAAAETAAAIDQLRERYGCAFWIEHHVPKGDGSAGRRTDPVGSSYWMRWPEFGLVLKRAKDAEATVYALERFRGDRDVRCWPDQLLKNAGRWPWTADYDPEQRSNLFDAIDEEGS